MKKVIISILLLLLISSTVFGDKFIVSFDEEIKNSDLIVVGTLKNISEKIENFEFKGQGIIEVEQVIAGDVKTIRDSLFKSNNEIQLNYEEFSACDAGFHRRIENKKGIFFLKLDNNRKIKSKYFESIEDLPKIIEKIKDTKESGKRKLSLFLTFLVIVTSFSFYYFLYRSRFKIR